jgi:hypothetical protein
MPLPISSSEDLSLPRIEAMLRAGYVLFLPLGGDGPRWAERERRPVIVRAVQTCVGCPALWDAWDEDGNYWAFRFRNGHGAAQRGETGPGPHAGLSFDDDDDMAGVISLEEFCERVGLELRLA